MYADDILLIAPSMSVLQKLACEKKLDGIDMVINVKKSSCLRVGPRHKVTCAEITTSDGNNLLWVKEIHYLGIFIACHVSFRCFIQITPNVVFIVRECKFFQGWSLCLRGGDTGVDP